MTSFCCLCPRETASFEDIIQDNHGHHSDLAEFWWGDQQLPFDTKCKKYAAAVSFGPIMYIAGSIGYAPSVIRKVILLAVNFLNTLNPWSSRSLKDRGIILLDTLLALGIAIIGCVCPPLAYYLDSATQNAMCKLKPK